MNSIHRYVAKIISRPEVELFRTWTQTCSPPPSEDNQEEACWQVTALCVQSELFGGGSVTLLLDQGSVEPGEDQASAPPTGSSPNPDPNTRRHKEDKKRTKRSNREITKIKQSEENPASGGTDSSTSALRTNVDGSKGQSPLKMKMDDTSPLKSHFDLVTSFGVWAAVMVKVKQTAPLSIRWMISGLNPEIRHTRFSSSTFLFQVFLFPGFEADLLNCGSSPLPVGGWTQTTGLFLHIKYTNTWQQSNTQKQIFILSLTWVCCSRWRHNISSPADDGVMSSGRPLKSCSHPNSSTSLSLASTNCK